MQGPGIDNRQVDTGVSMHIVEVSTLFRRGSKLFLSLPNSISVRSQKILSLNLLFSWPLSGLQHRNSYQCITARSPGYRISPKI